MNDESVSSPRKREGAAPRDAQQARRAQALGDGLVLGVVTALHLWLIVYLTIPPAPMNEPRVSLAIEDVGALKVRFVDATPRVGTRPVPSVVPAVPQTLPASRVNTAGPRNTAPPAKAPVPAVPLESPPDEQGTETQTVAPTPGNSENAYGNPLLRGEPGGNAAADGSRLPGIPDHAFVRTIALKESPSPEQIIKGTGQYMNCSQVRIARFLSASEMDKRHITTHQLDQAFTEFGCK
jgi:hypothetical protein